MAYTRKQVRDAAGAGDETGPPEVRMTPRKMMKQMKRTTRRKTKR